MQEWYRFTTDRPSPFAETVYSRFLERLKTYTEGALSEDALRQHALRYLVPTIHLAKSPFAFPFMAEAVNCVRSCVEKEAQKKIVLYGDRDADGVTSTAMLHLFFRDQLKLEAHELTSLVPREEDKYGVTFEVAERIIAEKPTLLFTLDCGSSNKNELAYIKEKTGCKIIVIDHHFIPESSNDYPSVEAFINPKLAADLDFLRDYCTAAICVRFIQAFLYSFSREYNETVSIETAKGKVFLRNGVRVEENAAHSNRTYVLGVNPTDEKHHNLEAIFAHSARENLDMARLWRFYQKVPQAFSPTEIFNAVQSASFRKSYAILRTYLPLAAIGLVADMMPVYADNRILIKEGLSAIVRAQQTLPMGLLALLKRLNLTSAVTEQDLGFTLCPVINAAGRMGSASDALDALLEKDPLNAAKAAAKLTQVNDRRKEASQNSLDLLSEALDARSETGAIAVAHHAGFHRGISGLIASKIAEQFSKPALVLVPDGDCYRGSVRAFRNENVFALLDALKGHLLQFGGHRQAAGFSVSEECIQDFLTAVFEIAPTLFSSGENEERKDPYRNFFPPLSIDTQKMRIPLWEELLAHAPYGVMNPHPVLELTNTGKLEVSALGKTGAHATVKFSAAIERTIQGVWFFHNGEATNASERDDLKVRGEPQIGYFMGRTQYRFKILQVSSTRD